MNTPKPTKSFRYAKGQWIRVDEIPEELTPMIGKPEYYNWVYPENDGFRFFREVVVDFYGAMPVITIR